MFKNISKLGTALTKAEQKSIIGGYMKPGDRCNYLFNCPTGEICICGDNNCTYGTCAYA